MSEEKRGGAEMASTEIATTYAHPTPVDVEGGLLASDDFEERYTSSALLGSGGMGEVRSCADRRVGRRVAMKVLKESFAKNPDLRARFLREARVQAQLEHPSIIPVYDVGTLPDGQPYFTMRQAPGKTLREVLESLRAGDKKVLGLYSTRKLLEAFGRVCQAVEFAHRRGVVHRDLKPENVILGEFGEIYVLDWGIAAVRTAPDLPPVDGIEGSGAMLTRPGSVLGTPEYMAPEQREGRAEPRSDVYSLGMTLREIVECARSGVAAEVPPELDALWRRATAPRMADRPGSALELFVAIERFLDGDRDLELRKKLASDHAQEAESAAERALSEATTATDDRRRALREVSKALAFEPGNERAMRTLVRVLTTPPLHLPPDAEKEWRKTQRKSVRVGARLGATVYLAFLAFPLLAVLMGVRSWPLMALSIVCNVLTYAVVLATLARKDRGPNLVPLVLSSALAIACVSVGFGPLVLIPGIAAVNVVGISLLGDLRFRVLSAGVHILAIVVPVALGALGWVSPWYEYRDGAMCILPHAHAFPPLGAQVTLLSIGIATIVLGSAWAGRYRDALQEAQRKLYLQAWQLRQLAP